MIMMQDELKRLLSEIPSAPIAGTLSDDALEALSHICVSVHDMIAGDGLDDEYGDRKDYGRMLDRLYGICRARSGERERLSRRARLVPTLYELLHRPMRVPELGRASECRERMGRLVGDWMQAPVEGETGVLRCIAYLLCYEPEEAREREPAYVYFRRRIAEWLESCAVAEGSGRSWPGLSEEETLERVLVLSLASDLLGIPGLDKSVGLLGRACVSRVTDRVRTALGEKNIGLEDLAPEVVVSEDLCPNDRGLKVPESNSLDAKDIDPNDSEPNNLDAKGKGAEAVTGYSRAGADARLLYLCYEASMWGAGGADVGTVGSVVSCARLLHGCSARGSDARLWCLAVLADAACREVDTALQDEYFAHSA